MPIKPTRPLWPASHFLSIRRENRRAIESIKYSKDPKKDTPIKEAVESLLDLPKLSIFQKLKHSLRIEYILTHHPDVEVGNGQYGDTIIQVTTLTWRFKKYAYISCVKVNKTDASLKFLHSANISFMDCLAEMPDLILLDVGPNPTEIVQAELDGVIYQIKKPFKGAYELFIDDLTRPVCLLKPGNTLSQQLEALNLKPDQKNHIANLFERSGSDQEKLVEIPGEINYRYTRLGLYAYDDWIESSHSFLKDNPLIKHLFLKENIPLNFRTENLWIFERVQHSMRYSIFKSTQAAYPTLSRAVLGNQIFSLSTGLQQGALLVPVMNMLENDFGVITFVTAMAVYFLPMLYNYFQMDSASMIDLLKSAEKEQRLSPIKINQQLRKIQLRIAGYAIASGTLLLLVFSNTLWNFLTPLPWGGAILVTLYLLGEISKNKAEYMEEDSFFRILKNTIGRHAEHAKHLMTFRSYEHRLRTLGNLLGLSLGLLAMKINPWLGLMVGVLGWLWSSFSKLIFPLYGFVEPLVMQMNQEPFRDTANTLILIPEKVFLSNSENLDFSIKRKTWEALNPKNIQLMIKDPHPQFTPKIIEKERVGISPIRQRWILRWPNGLRLQIINTASETLVWQKTQVSPQEILWQLVSKKNKAYPR